MSVMLKLKFSYQLDDTPRSRGFTIVELLIVMVVIGILATISIVAYSGVQGRAKQSVVQNTSKQVASKIMAYEITEGEFPADLNSIGIKGARDGVEFQYTVLNSSNPKTWCVSASQADYTYRVSSSTPNPEVGVCDGHHIGNPDVNPVQSGLIGTWDRPTKFNATTVPQFKMAIFGGKYLDLPTGNGDGWQQMLSSRDDSYGGSPNQYYCYRKPSGLSTCNFPGSKRGMDEKFSWSIHDYIVLLGGRTGFGSHSAAGVSSYDWLGPMRVVAYDRVLTDQERGQVLAWLKVQVMNE